MQIPADEATFAFAEEDNVERRIRTDSLVVLSVDDDPGFQQSLKMALSGFRFHDSPLEILTASSATEAAKLLAERPDVSTILLDVVMETDDAGLRLVRSVREVLGNSEVRIVLVTGQPGLAPMQETLQRLDISDYWTKTELHRERLHGIMTTSLRTWQEIRGLARAKRGLQLIVEASNSLARTKDLNDFSERVIVEMSRLLGVPPDGLVCVQHDAGSALNARLVGVAGRFASMAMQELSSIEEGVIRDMLVEALTKRCAIEAPGSQVLFFDGADSTPPAAAYLATARLLDDTERDLLRVFATNANSGLINVALTSRLDRMAYEDPLLRIPNRNALQRSIKEILEIEGARNRVLLFIELEQYAQSSLTLGIEQGQQMLVRLCDQLKQAFPPPCIVAHLHEGVFAVLGPTLLLAQHKIDVLEQTNDPSDAPLIGLTTARVDLDGYVGSERSVVAAGPLLLKRARMPGNGGHIEYKQGEELEDQASLLLSHKLYKSLRGEGIGVAFQAQFDLSTGDIVGAEVLARWRDDDGSEIPPARFIPVAEATGMIVPLGRQVLDLACEALVAIDRAGFPGFRIAVNVSPIQFHRREFFDELMATVSLYGVLPRQIELEITESVVMADFEADTAILSKLREAGFAVAIDDFGTGYSSLRYVQALPVTTLKLDRHFTSEIGLVGDERSIADMILMLGQRLGISVLAEGVETEAQADWLTEHGCDCAQGYRFARPEPLEALLDRLRKP